MMFGIDSLYIWLAVIIISVAVEAFTLTLCGIWFAAGGVAALIAASLSVGLMGQWIVFIVFSALLLVLVRPLCRRFLGSRQQATNADRIIGQTAVVTEPIDNILETGAVKITERSGQPAVRLTRKLQSGQESRLWRSAASRRL